MDKHSKIYQAALDLFGDYGLQKVNMQEIADAAGVSKKTLYNHFDGKENLFHKTMEWHINSIINFFENLDTDSTMTLVDKLTKAVQYSFETLGYKSSSIFTDLRRYNPYLKASPIYHIQTNINLYISHLITEAQTAEICRNDIHPNIITNCIVLVMNGILSWENIVGDSNVQPWELFNTSFSLLIQSLLTEKGAQEISLSEILNFKP